jgi:ABC-type bacteriocin/lantibiotic exporter with double-glycine peptidase domain
MYANLQSSWIFLPSGVLKTKPLFVDGVCIQSTKYSCGAAVLVTVLRHWGIPSSEKEMATLSYTTMGSGTKMIRIANALMQKVEPLGLKVGVLRLDWEELGRVKKPCIVDIRSTLFSDHVVVVFDLKDDWVEIGDPSCGRRALSKEDFLEDWRGYGIVLYKGSPYER